ncbi:acyltransferase family protein [Faecalibacterium prausnitzii]
MKIIFVLCIVAIILSAKPTFNNGGGTYTRELTDSIKGVSAILIILHHFSWQVIDASGPIVWLYREANLFAVGCFLFFSGYGVAKNIHTKDECKKIFKYVFRILVTYITVFLMKIIIDVVIGKMDYNVFYNFLTLQMYPSNLWYIKGQLFCYLLFVSGYMILGKNAKMISYMTGLILVWIGIGLALGRSIINDAWYDTLLLFPMGVMISINEVKFIDKAKRHPLLMSGVITIVATIIIIVQKKLLYVVVPIWSVLLYLIFANFIAVKGKAWTILGKHSLSIFLIHLVLIDYAKKFAINIENGWTILSIVGATIMASIVLDLVVNKILNEMFLIGSCKKGS